MDRWSNFHHPGPSVQLCHTDPVVSSTARSPRRSDALSQERIVRAAIEILDLVGEGELTVRGLTAHLATGRGAIYHHVSGKDELLSAAADEVIAQVLTGVSTDQEPEAAVRALALGIFDAIDTHPWVGSQLSREPLQPAVLRIWKGVGTQLQRLGVDDATLSDAGSALVSYVLGAAAQYVAGPRRAPDEAGRQAYLDKLAVAWAEHDPDPLVTRAAAQLREHDDRQQFVAGVDIFLAGVRRRDR
jgi:AcrR family transcriptional regulator